MKPFEPQQPIYPGGMAPSAPPSYAEATQQYPQGFVPPPPPGFNVPRPEPQNPGITVGVAHVVTLALGPSPARITCPTCRADVLTNTETEPSCVAHLCCLVLALLQCYLCSCLPYCMESLKNVRHTCPNCKAYLGAYQP